jgi:hypothetical protein
LPAERERGAVDAYEAVIDREKVEPVDALPRRLAASLSTAAGDAPPPTPER